jgi:hypothetical protein
MITRAEVERLGARHVVAPTMLSLYLAVRPPSASLSQLADRADELVPEAEAEAEAETATEAETASGDGDRDGRRRPLPGLLRERAVHGRAAGH